MAGMSGCSLIKAEMPVGDRLHIVKSYISKYVYLDSQQLSLHCCRQQAEWTGCFYYIWSIHASQVECFASSPLHSAPDRKPFWEQVPWDRRRHTVVFPQKPFHTMELGTCIWDKSASNCRPVTRESKHLTENCSLLNKLFPGDNLLADWGFDMQESVRMMCADVQDF